jgi:hypothetical protein
MDKADITITRAINMDSIPAWADHGRGRGRGSRGSNPNWTRGRGGGVRGAARGRGGGSRGGFKPRGGGGRRGRGKSAGDDHGLEMTGSNAVPVPERKRKLNEESIDEAKKAKLMALTSEPPSAPAPSPSTSMSARGRAHSERGRKSLLGQLLNSGKVDAGRGFGLFD